MPETRLIEILLKKEAVIFDLFHTLTSIESTLPPGPTTSDLLGITQKQWNEQLLERSHERLIGKIRDPLVFIEQMAHAINPEIPSDLIHRAAQNRIQGFRGALLQISSSTRQILQKIKATGKKIGLLSNADVSEMAGWAESPIAMLFDSVVFSCEVGYIKPEKEIYDISLRQLSVEPRKAVFVGDGGSRELEGAKEMGMTTVFISGLIREL